MVIEAFGEPPQGEFLAGRVALVTGGARRLGRLMALALGSAGACVVVHCHTSQGEAEKTAREIGDAVVVVGDLADAALASALPSRAAALCGQPLDILINNAAVFIKADTTQTTPAQWDLSQAVNLRAPFLLAQGFARQLPGETRGDIINLNDARALHGDPEHFAYAVAKAGLHAVTQNLALALAPRVAVNELALGAVMAPERDEYVKTPRCDLPGGRFPAPSEVVQGMMHLLSAPEIRGETIWVDGGQYSSG